MTYLQYSILVIFKCTSYTENLNRALGNIVGIYCNLEYLVSYRNFETFSVWNRLQNVGYISQTIRTVKLTWKKCIY